MSALGQYATCQLFRFYVDLLLDDDRERKRKRRALARLRLNPDFAPVHLNERFDMASPKPVPPFLRVIALSACWNS